MHCRQICKVSGVSINVSATTFFAKKFYSVLKKKSFMKINEHNGAILYEGENRVLSISTAIKVIDLTKRILRLHFQSQAGSVKWLVSEMVLKLFSIHMRHQGKLHIQLKRVHQFSLTEGFSSSHLASEGK